MQREHLVERAKRILQENWQDGFTIPTKRLYPFQWNWDSGFIALGHAHVRLDYAIRELESLYSSQWENGMLPHIVFHTENETTYFPNHDFWDCHVNRGAPEKPKSSGITQPAVQGFVLERLLNLYPDNEDLIAFAKHIFSKMVHGHRFLYSYRDPQREGLMFIFHPWESGRDNSPIWDESLDRIEIKPDMIPAYERRDTSIAPSDERPTSYQYDRYVYLLQLGKQHSYDGSGIFQESPFLVQDTLMNAALIRSNQGLINIGERFGFDVGELEEWQQQSRPAFHEKLWNDTLQTYTAYDLRGKYHIPFKEIGGFSALFAEIPPPDIAARMNGYLRSLHNRGYYLCPSFDVDSTLFDSKRYWRGPVWSQMNWLIYQGLKAYGFDDTADLVRSDLIELVEKLGFYEYLEPQKDLVDQLNTGYGGGSFSWTAACILDFLMEA